jgi:bifunctional non-homologous end joining protein LigD
LSKWHQIREWRKTHPREDKPPSEAIPPLLPTLVKAIPQGLDWTHEVKWDGYRIGVHLKDGQARIYTRNLFDWTERFPSITRAVETLKASEAFIDGEAVVLDDKGLSSFSRIQVALGAGGDPDDIVFVAFDLLRLNGRNLRERPLKERRAALVELLGDPIPEGILLSREVEGTAEQIYRHACRLGLEGVVSKRKDSPYTSGRRREWVKTKCVQSDGFIAIGYVHGKGFGGLEGNPGARRRR